MPDAASLARLTEADGWGAGEPIIAPIAELSRSKAEDGREQFVTTQ